MGIALVMSSLSFPAITTEFSEEKAKLVDLVLKRIAKQHKKSVFLKKISFSEDELNSYLNLVYIKRYTPEVKYVKLKLNKNNFVSGSMKIKLEGKKYDKVPSFFKNIDVDTSGRVECNKYRMRFIFETLQVNGTTLTPEVLDEAFGQVQTRTRIKKSMYDWFNLLPGIKNVIVDYKKLTIFY